MWSATFFLLTATASVSPVTFLFHSVKDVSGVWGLVRTVGSTVTATSKFKAPPLDYSSGAVVFGAFGPNAMGIYELYAANTTGWEPAQRNHWGSHEDFSEKLETTVLRTTTADFVTYTSLVPVLKFKTGGDPKPYTMPTVKSMARDLETNDTIMVVYSSGIVVYRSHDFGQSWTCTTDGTPNFVDKDDVNVFWVGTPVPRFIDMQITKQQWPLPFCDNLDGCDNRRVVSARNSTDSVVWSNDSGLRTPDPDLDPPELQFYRIRPFLVPGVWPPRAVAQVLLYAPSPWVSREYGRDPPLCAKPPNVTHCHAPHMYTEWWLGPSDITSNPPENVATWRRDLRETRVAPPDAWLLSPPLFFADSFVWVGDGAVYTLPRNRIAGLYAPANGVFTTLAFTIPQNPVLSLNANATWGNRLVTGGCDEGCAAYIMCELVDPVNGSLIPGFDRERLVLMDGDWLDLPLQWNGSSITAIVGQTVALRVHFRDATVYALKVTSASASDKL